MNLPTHCIAIDSHISFWFCNAKQYAMILLTFMVLFLVTFATEFTFFSFKTWWVKFKNFFLFVSSHDNCRRWRVPTFILVTFRSKIYTVFLWLVPSLEQYPPLNNFPFFSKIWSKSVHKILKPSNSFPIWRCQKN